MQTWVDDRKSVFLVIIPKRIFHTPTHPRTLALTMTFRSEGGHCSSGFRGSTPCTERLTYRHGSELEAVTAILVLVLALVLALVSDIVVLRPAHAIQL